MKPMREQMENWMINIQKKISDSLAKVNAKPYVSNPGSSDHKLNGTGVANIFRGGDFLEKGGVNFSRVEGKVFGDMINMLSIEHKDNIDKYKYFATGMSLVLHPHSPMVPTIHANYRYFEVEDEKKNVVSSFFGGGTDLTPFYLFEEDSKHFHQVLKNACDKTKIGLYKKLKKEADDYFYLPHRQEHRGIGGIFSLRMNEGSQEETSQWIKNCSSAFLEGYLPIVERRKDLKYDKKQKEWQLVRRGRYVEFNLLHDVGTHFGLKSGGNVENILMSLPPSVSWEFKHTCEKSSPEEKLLEVIKNPREWVEE